MLHGGPEGAVVLELLRGGMKPEPGKTVQAFCNLTGLSQVLPVKDLPTMLFSSEAGRYDGNRRPDSDPTQLLPFECMVFGPTDWKQEGVN